MAKSIGAAEIDLQSRVDQLDEILAPPAISDAVALARAALRAAKADYKTVQVEVNEICQRKLAAPGHKQPPEVEAARARLDAAEKKIAAAAEAHKIAKQKTGEQFLKAVVPKVSKAIPILRDVCEVMNEAIRPLLDLHRHALNAGAPMPRLVAAALEMAEAVRLLTAVLNRATVSHASAADDD